jgi:hypothetical protein
MNEKRNVPQEREGQDTDGKGKASVEDDSL